MKISGFVIDVIRYFHKPQGTKLSFIRRQLSTPIEYHGWIYGNVKDEWILRELGVTGKMIWKVSDNSNRTQPFADTKIGIFEYCTITMEVAKKLRDNYPAFPPQTFTGIDKDGNQTINQPLWKGEYED